MEIALTAGALERTESASSYGSVKYLKQLGHRSTYYETKTKVNLRITSD